MAQLGINPPSDPQFESGKFPTPSQFKKAVIVPLSKEAIDIFVDLMKQHLDPMTCAGEFDVEKYRQALEAKTLKFPAYWLDTVVPKLRESGWNVSLTNLTNVTTSRRYKFLPYVEPVDYGDR